MSLNIKGLVGLLGHRRDSHMPGQLFDTDRGVRGAALHTDHCHVAAFGPDASDLTLLFPQEVSFSKRLGIGQPTHFVAREYALRAVPSDEAALVIVGRGVFYSQGVAAVLGQATDDLIGISLPTRWPNPIGMFGRDWYAAVMCSSYATHEAKVPRLILRPISLLTEVVS